MIRVGIVDDSAMVRTILKRIIEQEKGFKVVGSTGDVYAARSMILQEKPDVLTLDVEMPGMDGLEFLERLMTHYPIPVIMVSSLTTRSSVKGIRALELGAVEVVGKPRGDSPDSIRALKDELIAKLRIAARANIPPPMKRMQAAREKTTSKTARHPTIPSSDWKVTDVKASLPLNESIDAIVIGSSTGGILALRTIFSDLPRGLPPLFIVQHMPATFTKRFAQHLNQITEIDVREAQDNDYASRSDALIAPGNYHMLIHRKDISGRIKVRLEQSPKIHYQRPAVDPLFISAAEKLGKRVLALVLTGMGKDGLKGSIALSKVGGTILVQDEKSCTVYGMPAQVKKNIDSALEVPLSKIASVLSLFAT